MSTFLPVNGPTLNALRSGQPDVDGGARLADIEAHSVDLARELDHDTQCSESSAEHELIDRMDRAAADGIDFTFGFGAYGYRLALQAASQSVANLGENNGHQKSKKTDRAAG